jgi:hypothetical protein
MVPLPGRQYYHKSEILKNMRKNTLLRMTILLVSVIALSVSVSLALPSTIFESLANFCHLKGFKFVTVVSLSEHQSSANVLTSFLAKKHVFTRMINQFDSTQTKYGQDFIIFIADRSENVNQTILDMMSRNKIERSLVVLNEPDISKLETILEKLNNPSSGFYVLLTDKLNWFKVMTLRNVDQPIINPILNAIEIYNLKAQLI